MRESREKMEEKQSEIREREREVRKNSERKQLEKMERESNGKKY